MEFGIRLKKERENKKISQEDFAKKLGISRSSVGNYETNRNMPTTEILDKMADILDCSIDYLLGKSDIRNPKEIRLDTDKIQIGLSTKDYTNITDEQKKQIEDFAKFVLKDNLKNKNK